MPEQVKVEDLEVFRLFRVALLKFAQAADQSLAGADSHIAHVHSWLESEQASYWQSQFRKRSEAVTAAREALRQKTLYKDATGRKPGAAHEEKVLAQCLAAVEEARCKIEAIRKWLPRLEKEADNYRGGVSRLRGQVTGDIPRAVALLDRLAATLEEYVVIQAPAAPDSATSAPFGESISRGGDAIPEPPPRPEHASPAPTGPPPGDQPASGSPPPAGALPEKEGRNVADGQ